MEFFCYFTRDEIVGRLSDTALGSKSATRPLDFTVGKTIPVSAGFTKFGAQAEQGKNLKHA